VINIDDETGCQWSEQLASTLNVITYSFANKKADVYASNVNYLPKKTTMQLSIRLHSVTINVPLLGQFNVLNLLAVAAVLVSIGKSHLEIEQALNSLQAVPGRMQVVVGEKMFAVRLEYF